MGKGLKKTLPNPECELSFYPEELCFVLKKNKKKQQMVLWEKT